jgi:hypothetical protein
MLCLAFATQRSLGIETGISEIFYGVANQKESNENCIVQALISHICKGEGYYTK